MFGRGYRVLAEEIRLTRESIREDGERWRESIREERLRSDRRYEQTIRGLERTIEENSQAWREGLAEIRALREDFRQEAKAHRAALFRMLDRLGPGPDQAPASG